MNARRFARSPLADSPRADPQYRRNAPSRRPLRQPRPGAVDRRAARERDAGRALRRSWRKCHRSSTFVRSARHCDTARPCRGVVRRRETPRVRGGRSLASRRRFAPRNVSPRAFRRLHSAFRRGEREAPARPNRAKTACRHTVARRTSTPRLSRSHRNHIVASLGARGPHPGRSLGAVAQRDRGSRGARVRISP
jgi:hypothetical protein